MRKTHWACLLLGVIAGVVLGVGLVIVQLKYGRSPVVSGDFCAEGQPSAMEEPKPLSEEPPDGTSDEPPISDVVLGAPIQVPIGPVEVSRVQRISTDALESGPANDPPPNLEQVERRMLNHLIQHARAAAQGQPPEETPVAKQPETLPAPSVAADVAASVPPTGEPVEPPAVLTQRGKPLRYFGLYRAAIRPGDELTLPAEVHEMMASPRPRVLYVLPGDVLPDQPSCLCLYTDADMRKLLDVKVWFLERDQRLFLSKIRRIEVGANGDLRLPRDLVQQVGFASSTGVIIGNNDHFEIWEQESWHQYCNPTAPVSFADLTNALKTVVKHTLGDIELPVWFEAPQAQTGDSARRMRELLEKSEDLRVIQEYWERTWFTDSQPE
jgi:DNA-binding transcriptional regulator/RsmH inhibitor MraZ